MNNVSMSGYPRLLVFTRIANAWSPQLLIAHSELDYACRTNSFFLTRSQGFWSPNSAATISKIDRMRLGKWSVPIVGLTIISFKSSFSTQTGMY